MLYAFPQELVDAVASATGGGRIRVKLPKLGALMRVEANSFYLEGEEGEPSCSGTTREPDGLPIKRRTLIRIRKGICYELSGRESLVAAALFRLLYLEEHMTMVIRC